MAAHCHLTPRLHDAWQSGKSPLKLDFPHDDREHSAPRRGQFKDHSTETTQMAVTAVSIAKVVDATKDIDWVIFLHRPKCPCLHVIVVRLCTDNPGTNLPMSSWRELGGERLRTPPAARLLMPARIVVAQLHSCPMTRALTNGCQLSGYLQGLILPQSAAAEQTDAGRVCPGTNRTSQADRNPDTNRPDNLEFLSHRWVRQRNHASHTDLVLQALKVPCACSRGSWMQRSGRWRACWIRLRQV